MGYVDRQILYMHVYIRLYQFNDSLVDWVDCFFLINFLFCR